MRVRSPQMGHGFDAARADHNRQRQRSAAAFAQAQVQLQQRFRLQFIQQAAVALKLRNLHGPREGLLPYLRDGSLSRRNPVPALSPLVRQLLRNDGQVRN